MSTSKALMMTGVFILFTILTLCKANTLICHEKEKQALLSFKSALTDPTNRLSSWSGNVDCCGWTGVRCDNVSGQVVGLHLGNWNVDMYATGPYGILGGELSVALLELQFLKHLVMQSNDFGGNPIPSFLGSMQSLTVLCLFNASFGGKIPPQLGNLSSLQYLGLGCSSALGCELHIENFSWISRLSSLKTLAIQGLDLHKEVHWLEYVSVLPSLSTLWLVQCQLDSLNPYLKFVNFTSLSYLCLHSNNFDHELPNWLYNLSSNLMALDLSNNSLQGQIPSTISNLRNLLLLNFSYNHLEGQIPESLGQLNYLMGLYLHYNSLDGQVPSSIGNLSFLDELYLHNNQLSGALPESIGLLSNLRALSMARNPLSGIISEAHFTKLSNLKYLEMCWTNLTFSVSSNWIPPFQLQAMLMISCKMGPQFPAWLRTQRSLQVLYLRNSGIVDTAPSWLWTWASQIHWILHLSDNQISGDLSEVVLNSTRVDLTSNCFTGHLPRLSQNVIDLRIANNPFSGHLSSSLCRKRSGRSKLEVLDLSNNSLWGEIDSNCLMYWPSLTHLNLGDNNLSGKIPDSIGSLFALKALHLYNNTLVGDIPASLLNCSFLGLLDLADNELSGNIPSWIGEMSNLLVLSLRSNKLKGNIPPQMCQLSSVIAVDLANNKLSGAIPKCISNFSTMAKVDTTVDDDFKVLVDNNYLKNEDISLVVKGRKSEYASILALVRTIDFSSNNLSGSIPTEISSLSGLRFLNLSQNHLTGRIPENVGAIKSLESLDVSRNHLSGAIPESITNLSFLDHLDLSYNNLCGIIPSSTQIQSFNALSFIGNAGLCGPPLTANCTKKKHFEGIGHIHEESRDWRYSEMAWFYIGMASGFVLSFWGVFGILILKRDWRHAYFRFLDDTRDQLYVATVLTRKWLRENLRRYLKGPRCLGCSQEGREDREGGGS